MEEMELYRRLAALERRVNKLEAGLQEIDHVIDPQGWIRQEKMAEDYCDGR